MFIQINNKELTELLAALAAEIYRKKQEITPNDKKADKNLIEIETLYTRLLKIRSKRNEN